MIFDEEFLNTIPEGFLIAERRSLQLLFVNSALCNILGYESPELLHLTLTDISPRETGGDAQQMTEHLLEKKTRMAEDIPLRHKHKGIIYANITGTLISYNNSECVMLFLRDITERRAVVTQLKQSEERLVAAQRIGNMGDWEWVIGNNKLYWSEQVFRIFGVDWQTYTPSYTGFLDFIHPEDREMVVNAVNEALEKRVRYSIEHRIVIRNGIIRYVHEQGEVVYDGKGNALRMHGTVQDITTLKQSQIRLKENQIELKGQQMALNNAALVSETDLTGKIIYANEQFCQISGYSREELIGQNHRILRHPDMPKELYDDMWRTISIGKVWTGIIKNKNKQGGAYWVKATITPVLNENGKPIKYIGVRVDITDRMKLENELRIKESAIESSINGILITDIYGKIVYANNYLLHMYGYYSEDQIVGKNVTEVTPVPERTAVKMEEIRQVGWWKGEIPIEQKDGSCLFGQVSANIIYDDNQQPVYIMASISDITEKIIAERKLQETLDRLELMVHQRTIQLNETIAKLNKEVEERKQVEIQIKRSLTEKQVLLSEIHHRVKNNLQIVASLMYLQQENIISEDAMQVFRQAEYRIKAMALIHETIYQTSNFTEIRYNEYLESLISYIYDSYKTFNVQVQTNIEDVYLSIDTATNCGIIIIELLTNAFKYAFPGGIPGTITINMKPLGDNCYKLVVSDNGIGFPAGIDFRKSNSLGLQLVCGIIKQLDGNIEMDRTSGTVFTITFRDVKKREYAKGETVYN